MIHVIALYRLQFICKTKSFNEIPWFYLKFNFVQYCISIVNVDCGPRGKSIPDILYHLNLTSTHLPNYFISIL